MTHREGSNHTFRCDAFCSSLTDTTLVQISMEKTMEKQPATSEQAKTKGTSLFFIIFLAVNVLMALLIVYKFMFAK